MEGQAEDPPNQQSLEASTRGQSTPAPVTALDQTDERKLFEALDQIDSHVESHEIRETYRKVMTQLSILLDKITPEELRAIRVSLQAGRWELEITYSLDDIPNTTKELLRFLVIWTTPLDVRMIEYVEEAIEDKETKKKLVEALKKHRDELKSFSEKSLKYLKEQGVKLVNRKDFTSLKPEEYLLRELFRLQKYLQTDPCFFEGFIIKWALIYPETSFVLPEEWEQKISYNNNIVATQDEDLQTSASAIPGVPLLHIIRNTIVLKNPSEGTKEKVEEIVRQQTDLTPHETAVLEELDSKLLREEVKRRKKKRLGGPNPLSVKKKRKRLEAPVLGSARNVRRKRRERETKEMCSQSKVAKLTE